MSLRFYIILMVLGTAVCWGAWALVLIFLDPASADWLGFLLFYSSLYLALVGSFAIIGMGLRLLFAQSGGVFREVAIAFRQAFFFGFMVIAALLLQKEGLFTWWNMLLLAAALTLIELFFLAMRHRQPEL